MHPHGQCVHPDLYLGGRFTFLDGCVHQEPSVSIIIILIASTWPESPRSDGWPCIVFGTSVRPLRELCVVFHAQNFRSLGRWINYSLYVNDTVSQFKI
jgi:hypothetical protein